MILKNKHSLNFDDHPLYLNLVKSIEPTIDKPFRKIKQKWVYFSPDHSRTRYHWVLMYVGIPWAGEG